MREILKIFSSKSPLKDMENVLHVLLKMNMEGSMRFGEAHGKYDFAIKAPMMIT